jgi:hypothetical protein
MRVNALAGVKTLLGFGPKIARSAAEQPDGRDLYPPDEPSASSFKLRS